MLRGNAFFEGPFQNVIVFLIIDLHFKCAFNHQFTKYSYLQVQKWSTNVGPQNWCDLWNCSMVFQLRNIAIGSSCHQEGGQYL
jgi:hypothetical protein